MKKISEALVAHGHENITAAHKTTFEITKETTLTKRGDCVIAVGANRGAADLSIEFKEALKLNETQLTIVIETDGVKDVVKASGNAQLSFSHPTDIVIRKTNYVCGRTIAVRANKAASDLSRKLVELLWNPNQEVKIFFTAEYR